MVFGDNILIQSSQTHILSLVFRINGLFLLEMKSWVLEEVKELSGDPREKGQAGV